MRGQSAPRVIVDETADDGVVVGDFRDAGWVDRFDVVEDVTRPPGMLTVTSSEWTVAFGPVGTPPEVLAAMLGVYPPPWLPRGYFTRYRPALTIRSLKGWQAEVASMAAAGGVYRFTPQNENPRWAASPWWAYGGRLYQSGPTADRCTAMSLTRLITPTEAHIWL